MDILKVGGFIHRGNSSGPGLELMNEVDTDIKRLTLIDFGSLLSLYI